MLSIARLSCENSTQAIRRRSFGALFCEPRFASNAGVLQSTVSWPAITEQAFQMLAESAAIYLRGASLPAWRVQSVIRGARER